MAEAVTGGPSRRSRTVRSRKVAVSIAQSIVDEITDRGHAPGTRLATERDMLERYNVGRGTLRESIRFLELNGIVTLKAGPGGGPIVATPDAHDMAGILGLFLQLHPTTFAAIIQAREVLEPAIARLAASATPSTDTRERITSSVEQMRRYLDDEENFVIENDRFHEAIAEASGNAFFAILIASLHQITDGMPLGVSYPLSRRKAVLKAHEAIHDAIVNEDPDAAELAMQRHIHEFRSYVEKTFPLAFTRTLRWSHIAQ